MAKHEGRSGKAGNVHGASNPGYDTYYRNANGRMTGRSGMPGDRDTSKPFIFTDGKTQVPKDMAAKVHNKFLHKTK